MARRFGCLALSVAAAFACMAGCANPQPPMSSASNSQLRPKEVGAATSPVLYVAHVLGQGSHAYSVISMVSLPQDKTVATISGYGYISGVCADPSGNVWAPNLRNGRWYVDEFPRGATKPTRELFPPRGWLGFTGCAVDSTSDDVAVLAENEYGTPYVLVWNGGRARSPARYPAAFPMLRAAYDDDQNLFVSGWEGGSDFFFEMGELVKGGSRVTPIKLDRQTSAPGDVQWDGTYVVVGTDVTRQGTSHPRLYRLQVSGASGHVVQVVSMPGLSANTYSAALFVLLEGSVIGTAGRDGDSLRTWAYPGGGKPTGSIGRYSPINGLTISE
jgi:hypothetical protein